MDAVRGCCGFVAGAGVVVVVVVGFELVDDASARLRVLGREESRACLVLAGHVGRLVLGRGLALVHSGKN